MSEVLFVGTSDAFGAGGRRQSAILLRGPNESVLLDCGPTTASGLNALAVARDEIDAIVVSHFHGDHFGGIPLLLLAARYEDERRRPLHIAGPPDIEERVRAASSALGHPIADREWSYRLEFHELRPGGASEIGPVRAGCFETFHQPESQPHGLVITSDRHRIVYSGDTGWFDDLPVHARGADLFVSECTLRERGFRFHLSYEELLERRDRFDCGRIILTHLGSEMCEARGQLEFETADDGLSIPL
jgi:ribonuclease BN (tRNA processing enzyme)